MTVVRWDFRVGTSCWKSVAATNGAEPAFGERLGHPAGALAKNSLWNDRGKHCNTRIGNKRNAVMTDRTHRTRRASREPAHPCNQLQRHHRRSTVDRRTYPQPGNHRECCAPSPPAGSSARATRYRGFSRARAATHRARRSRVQMESTPGETAATCAAPSRDARRSGSRASRSRTRSRRPIRRTRAHASRA